MNKEKILKLLKSKIGIGVISGSICFALGGAIFSDSKTITTLKRENSDLVSEYKSELANKDIKINELQSKVDEAKPWFEKQEEDRKIQEAKLAEEKVKKEAEEQAKEAKEAEEKAKKEAKEEAEALAKGVTTDAVKKTADSIIKKELDDKVTNTTLDSLQVNENLGTDSNKDVVVLANLSWSTKNSEKTTKKMLEMYSEHIAAILAPELAEGSEIALFWKAEYTGLNIKHSYYIKNGNAYKQ
ncbi:MAG: hypothetical protein ACRCVJ_01070 [Clostridium sp.]|uniref:hypothetical protein n=1 Tax=Clostridium sp. TaxID=1506 RepID=UPI003F3A30E1